MKEDVLKFTAKEFQPKPMTRRGVLSTVSQLYDPLGFLAPFSLKGKNILQKINKVDDDWNKEIPPGLIQLWKEWVKELGNLDDVLIPRCIKPTDFGPTAQAELHHFCDASLSGIGACSYMRLIDINGNVHTWLLLTKSRVLPSKGIITVPRLELQGAVVATQLHSILKKELNIKVNQAHFWMDSEIVLAYLSNEKKFHVYVANRVREIKMTTKAEQWHHVSTSENPADIASRGLDCSKLPNSMWFTGPTFLMQRNIQSRLQNDRKLAKCIADNDPEVKKIKEVKLTKTQYSTAIYDKLPKFSSLKRLITSFAYLQQIARKKSWSAISTPTVTQLEYAKQLVIKITQRKHFWTELDALHKGQTLPATSSIIGLNPYIDKEGILRIGGRATKSTTLSFEEKHPIIVPKNCHLAKLLIRDVHNKAHLGMGYTLNMVRQSGYWVISGTRITKDIVKNCVVCKKLRGSFMQQRMGELSEDRLQQTTPFTMTGIDCFGTFTVKERRTMLKRYGLLFTCFYSRAIHIEVVDDLTTDAFINALRCFLAIRGSVKRIYCDHGTNFIGGINEMNRQFTTMTNEEVKRYFINRRIEFITTTPTASHQGGVWERQIRTVRSVLNQAMSKYQGQIDTASLRTILFEVASIVNHRPLSTMHLNNHEEVPLTPNALLTGKVESTPPPPGDFDSEERYCKWRWKKVQAIAEDFWNCWKVEYLDNITKRQKWTTSQSNLKVGDIVMIVESDQPKNSWRLAVIEEVFHGQDDLVRKATVKVATKMLDSKGKPIEKSTVLQRPVQKLVKLL
ncbi:uncharacterized protein [Watersipora subatra]|uniref:uncharacterized protein n=1 Tax=Watersipora subatra TaxID=2589382 RepID=UPI00355B83C9